MFRERSCWFRLLIARIRGLKKPTVNGHAPISHRCVGGPWGWRRPPVGQVMQVPSSAGENQRLRTESADHRNTVDADVPEFTPAVRQIALAWPTLQPHIQDAILTLIDAARLPRGGDQPQ